MNVRRAILPVLAALATATSLPARAEQERLGLLEFRFETLSVPRIDASQQHGSIQLVRVGTAVNPLPHAWFGVGLGVGYSSRNFWPTMPSDRPSFAFAFDAFLRILGKPGPGLQHTLGLAFDGAASSHATILGGWLELGALAWLDGKTALSVVVAPGLALVGNAGSPIGRPLLKFSAGYQF